MGGVTILTVRVQNNAASEASRIFLFVPSFMTFWGYIIVANEDKKLSNNFVGAKKVIWGSCRDSCDPSSFHDYILTISRLESPIIVSSDTCL